MKKIILLGSIFLSLSTFARPNTDNPEKIGETTREALARVDSTVLSEEIYTIPEGTLLEITQEKFDWYKIRLPQDYIGYVHSSYVEQTSMGKGISKADNLNIRSKPNLDAPIIGELNKQDIIKIIAKRNGWYKIKIYPYGSAWVHKKSVKIVPKQKKQNKLLTHLDSKIQKKSNQPRQLQNVPTAQGILKRKKRLFAKAQYSLETENQLISLKLLSINELKKFVNNKVEIWGKFIDEDKPTLVVEKIKLAE